MKKYLFIAASMLAGMASCSAQNGDVTVILPANAPEEIIVRTDLINDLATSRNRSDLKTKTDTLKVENGRIVFPLDKRGPARYVVMLSEQDGAADFFASPGESISIEVKSLNPAEYSVAGSLLMEDITRLQDSTDPIQQEYIALMSSGQQPTQEQVQGIMDSYAKALTDFVKNNPKSPAVAYALLNMDGQELADAYAALTPEAKESILLPLLDRQIERNRQQMENEKRRSTMTSGNVAAPAFTLKDINGKDVSLSQFRGKWVILDFWGSWCGWCIKGMPKLKEAYKEYAGKVEIIGIDCNEPEEAWRAAVAKYELPWVNVYNPGSSSLLSDYLVEGFPTKVIVNPEGNIADITVGEDPAFYTKLATLTGGK